MGALAGPEAPGGRHSPPAEGALRGDRRRGGGRRADQRPRPRDRGADRTAAARRSRASNAARSRPRGSEARSRRCFATAPPSSTSGKPSWPHSRSSFAPATRPAQAGAGHRASQAGARSRRAPPRRGRAARGDGDGARGRPRAVGSGSARQGARARRARGSAHRRQRPRAARRAPEPEAATHLLYVARDGWQLVERDGPAPALDAAVDVDGLPLVVTRVGPSPLPGDPRACAYLEPARDAA